MYSGVKVSWLNHCSPSCPTGVPHSTGSVQGLGQLSHASRDQLLKMLNWLGPCTGLKLVGPMFHLSLYCHNFLGTVRALIGPVYLERWLATAASPSCPTLKWLAITGTGIMLGLHELELLPFVTTLLLGKLIALLDWTGIGCWLWAEQRELRLVQLVPLALIWSSTWICWNTVASLMTKIWSSFAKFLKLMLNQAKICTGWTRAFAPHEDLDSDHFFPNDSLSSLYQPSPDCLLLISTPSLAKYSPPKVVQAPMEEGVRCLIIYKMINI